MEAEFEAAAENFDPLDPRMAEGGPSTGERFWPLMTSIQEHCPVARSTAQGGFWLLTKFEDNRQAALDWQTFSSALRGGSQIEYKLDNKLIPIDTDPPFHRGFRRLINPYFTAEAASQSEATIRRIVNAAIDGFESPDRCEFVSEFAEVVAPRVVFECVFGLPAEAIEEVAPIVDAFAVGGEAAAAVMPAFAAWATEMLKDRRESEPRGDVIDVLVHGRPDGEALLTPAEQLSALFVLVAGGVETTAIAFSNIVLHLAMRPEFRERMKGPALARACEEFLRFEAPLPAVGRAAMHDTSVGGCIIPQGERVVLSYGAANRDPDVFENPNEIDLDRTNASKHLSFGAGPHFCPGAHLARAELRFGLEEFLRRVPDFTIDDENDVTWRTAMTRGVSRLPLRFAGPIRPVTAP